MIIDLFKRVQAKREFNSIGNNVIYIHYGKNIRSILAYL